MSNTGNIYPFIEVLKKGDEWTVADGLPNIDKIRKIMAVPLDDTQLAHNVRIKQLAEAAWTPSVKGAVDCSKDIVEAVESLRINTKLLEAGIDIKEGFEPSSVFDAELEYLINNDKLRQIVLKMVEEGTTQHYQKGMITLLGTRGEVCEKAGKILKLFSKQFSGTHKTWEDTVKLSKRLEYLIGKISKKKKKPKAEGETDGDVDDFLEEMMNRGLNAFESYLGGSPRYCGEPAEWGEMRVETPPLCEQILARNATSSKHPSEEGVYLRQPWRVYTDRMIFTRQRKKRGGSVLIDCSGSMHLNKDMIMDMVMSAPALVVALYSGGATDGVLRVVVKGGRKVENKLIDQPYCGNNTIDGPALKDWLAHQAQPRIWVSDGKVTGVGDYMTSNLMEDAANICEDNSIIRVNNLSEAKELFKKIEQSGVKIHPALRRRRVRELTHK